MKTRGVRVWLDVADIPPNSDWNAAIREAVAASARLLVVWSKESVVSPEVLAEVFDANAQKKEIVQVVVEDCKPPSQLSRFQSIDFRRDYDSGLTQLLDYLPVGRRAQRVKELTSVLPDNPYPHVPRIVE